MAIHEQDRQGYKALTVRLYCRIDWVFWKRATFIVVGLNMTIMVAVATLIGFVVLICGLILVHRSAFVIVHRCVSIAIVLQLVIPLPTVVAGGIIFYPWSFFFFFFFFRRRISEMALPTGNLSTQMVGYRCNFKNWVENLGGDPPLKFGGPKPLNVENQSRSTRSKLIVGIGPENEYPKLVSKFWGLPPKIFEGGQSSKS